MKNFLTPLFSSFPRGLRVKRRVELRRRGVGWRKNLALTLWSGRSECSQCTAQQFKKGAGQLSARASTGYEFTALSLLANGVFAAVWLYLLAGLGTHEKNHLAHILTWNAGEKWFGENWTGRIGGTCVQRARGAHTCQNEPTTSIGGCST